MVSLMVILFSTKCILFANKYIALLKLEAYIQFKNSDADLSWLLFFLKEANLYRPTQILSVKVPIAANKKEFVSK